MKKTAHKICAVFALSTLLLPAGAAARDTRHDSGVVTVVNSDTVDVSRVEKHLKANAPQSPTDNGLPRFAIVGKDHKYYIGIGAQFLGEAAFDFGDEMSSATLFTPSSITPSTPGNRSSLGFGWQSSSIYLNALAMPGTDNQVGIFFKMNFMGSGNNPAVNHFYAKYRGLTAGYTYGAFTDAAAEPATIDFEGPNGYPYMTMFNASWTQNFGKHLSAAIGIDAPTASLTTGTGTTTVNQRIPAIPLYVQYGYCDGNAHIRLSGLVRPMQYRNERADKNSTLTGLGIQLSGMTPVAGPLSFTYNAAYGRGIGTYLQDDNGLGLDAVGTEPGELGMVKSLGVTAGLSYAFSSKVTANAVYSHLSNWLPEHGTVSGDTYRYGDYAVVNVMYNVNRFVSAGVEYDYGHRKAFDGTGLHTNRVQVQFGVTF